MHKLSIALLTLLIAGVAGACSLIVPAAEGGGSGDSDTDSDSDTDTDSNTDCEPDAYHQCGDDGHVHAFDSCDVDEGLAQECGENAECVNTSDTQAECQCTGTWANPPECVECATGWAGANCNTLVIHVDDDSTASDPDGRDWDNAFQSINDGATEACAQLVANSDADGAEIWVADGLYHVFDFSNSNSVDMCERLGIYGGFGGFEEQLADRDPDQFVSVISGWNQSMTDRVYHVISGADDCVLDGLEVTGGSATLVGENAGGGLILTDGDMIINNCVFHSNEANWGGAIYLAGTTATITDSTFYTNDADQGGAIFADFTSSLATVHTSLFASNTSDSDGGAIYVYEGTLSVEQSLFVGNTTSFGGALGFTNANGTVETSLIVGNNASSVGGGIMMESGADVDFVNTTIWRNTASSGAAGIYSTSSTLDVGNSLLWDNMFPSTSTTSDVAAPTGTAFISYSGLSSGAWGGSNANHTPTSNPTFQPLFEVRWGESLNGNVFLPESGITILGFDGPPIPDGQLSGTLIDPDNSDNSYVTYFIIGNSENEIYVLGDATANADMGDWFSFYWPEISPLSPAIDMGSDSLGTTTVDYFGETRNDSYGRGNTGTITDMGAIETQTCVRVVSGGVGSTSDDGLEWDSSFAEIQDGIDEAYNITQSSGGPDRCEVWVSSGDYFIHPGGTGSNDVTLTLRDGVDLLGGFSSFSSTSRDSADPWFYPTIIWGQDAITPAYNSYHTITATDLPDAVLDGFIIVGGRAQYDPGSTFSDSFGGGLNIETSTMRVSRCKFHDNQGEAAGAIFGDEANLTLEDCHFSNNVAVNDYGGAVYANLLSDLSVNRCFFQTNYASLIGGALSNDNGGTVSASVFANNQSDFNNGGFDIFGGETDVVNVAFVGNRADSYGGGAGSNSNEPVRLTNTTFHGNQAGIDGGAIYNNSNSLTVTNSVLWGDSTGETYNHETSTMDVSYSDVQGEASATDNVISSNPDFELVYESTDFSGGVTSMWFNNWYFRSNVQAPGGTSWSDGEMAGKYVKFDATPGDIWYYILDNTMSTLLLPGDIEADGIIAIDDTFEIWDLRPDAASSPVVDTGTDTDAPEFDLEGVSRMDVPGQGDPGTTTDMGAYEFF